MILHPHFDAAESAFFERELEHIYAATYDILYPDLKFRELIPVSNEANAGAEEVTYQQFDRHGRAKIVANNAKDVPRIDLDGLEFTRPVREIAASYAWTVKEIKSAAMAGRDLNGRRAAAVRRAIEEKMDELAATGEAVNGIASGLLNDAAITIDAAAGNWDAATAANIIDDVVTSLELQQVATLGIERGTHLLLPPEQDVTIANLQRDTGSDMSVKDWIEKVIGLKVLTWNRCAGAGAGAVDRAVVYNLNPEKLHQEIPSEFEQLPVQAQGLELVVNAMASYAGMNFFYPESARYIDGI